MNLAISSSALAAFIAAPGLPMDKKVTKSTINVVPKKTTYVSPATLRTNSNCQASLQKGLTGNCLLLQPVQGRKNLSITQETQEKMFFSSFETALFWKTEPISKAVPAEALTAFANIAASAMVAEAGTQEIGFLVSSSQTPVMTVAYVGKIVGANLEKYVLNFDGDNLVYFDQDKTLLPSQQSQTPNSFPNKLKFLRDGKRSVNSLVRNAIVANSTNQGQEALSEANFVLVKQDVIILEKREMNIDNLPEREYYLREAQKIIKTHQNNVSESMEWIQKSRFNHNNNN